MLQKGQIRKEKGINDFVLLDEIREEPFLANLEERFHDDAIYTYIGNVVVSVNPYRQLPLYSKEIIELYRGRYIWELPPHIYAVAGDAYRDMNARKRDQCIIISGESGAGKTEASKVIMQYIAAVSGHGQSEVERVKDQLLKSNPVLEAFGNACTNRNDNSSRFGKYMDIEFNYKGDPVGGRISNYLLEKSRVVRQSKGERNFHIFYQVCRGGLVSGGPETHFYLSQGSNIDVKTIDDKKDFDVVRSALKIIGFSQQEMDNLFKLVVAVIHLGDVDFQAKGTEASEVSTPAVLESAASNFGITAKALATALVERTVAARGEAMKSTANVEKAKYARDAFAKTVYDRLFSWLVQRINKSILYKKGYGEDATVIGVLDIYGFEIFVQNGFEQFCINYCNEKLQQLFIELTLKAEQEEYLREGIQWEEVKYFNNAIICELIDMSNTGIIALLDEECTRPGDASDTTFLEKLNKSYKGHAHYESRETNRADKTLPDNAFRLKHYAGDVLYTVDGFLDKNIDNLFKDLKAVSFSSSNPVLKEMFPDGASINEASKRPVTSGTSFKMSLAELVTILMSKNPHYVRCIKPNDKKAPNLMDHELCVHQVRYLGLLENVRVRRAGFAFRQTYELWLSRYHMLSSKTWPVFRGSARDGVEVLMREMKLGPDDLRYGKTKIFIRSPRTLFKFEEEREKTFPRMALLVQKIWKGFRARKQWYRIRAAWHIQQKWRSYLSRRYWFQLAQAFKNVASDPDYGKNWKYPELPSVLDKFAAYLRKIHLNWRARKMITKLSAEQQKQMRKKVVAYTLFKGKKAWDLNRVFLGDYVSSDAVLGPKLNRAKPLINNEPIQFASIIVKLSRGGKPQERCAVLTNQHFFRLDSKSMKLSKPGLNLTDVSGVSLGNNRSTVVVVHTKTGFDLVMDFGLGKVDKVAEFVSELFTAMRKIKVQLSVKFESSIAVKVGGNKAKTLTFSTDPKATTDTLFKCSGANWKALCPQL